MVPEHTNPGRSISRGQLGPGKTVVYSSNEILLIPVRAVEMENELANITPSMLDGQSRPWLTH